MQTQKIIILAATFFILKQAAAQTPPITQLPNTPTQFHVTGWSEGASTRTVHLSWSHNSVQSNSPGSFYIQRRLITSTASGWTTLTAATALPSETRTFEDATLPRFVGRTFVFYRLRAKNNIGDSDAVEVATVGIITGTAPNQTVGYDLDADGITDAQESAFGGTDNDWTTAARDSNGDGIPNAWQANGVTWHPSVNGIVVTVDASRKDLDTATETKTISAAITKLTGTTLNLYRMIVVRPGVYNENINYTGTFQIAFVADKSAAYRYKECIIRGSGTAPVANVVGSCVFSGLVFERANGSQGAAISWAEPAVPVARVSVAGLVNCIFRGMNTGDTSVVEQSRGRLLIEHCTLINNGVNVDSPGHSYSLRHPTVSAEVPLKSTARLHAENSVFWNPVNISVPEFQSLGERTIVSSIMFRAPNVPSVLGTEHVNPNLKPSGYLLTSGSAAAFGGTSIAGSSALNDMHGESYGAGGYRARGADAWHDADADLIPDFADRLISDPLNASSDLDFDLMTELEEYQDDTDIYSSDSVYITRDEALRTFIKENDTDFLTRADGDSRYVMKSSGGDTVRVAPGGNIPMGSFSGGSPPP